MHDAGARPGKGANAGVIGVNTPGLYARNVTS